MTLEPFRSNLFTADAIRRHRHQQITVAAQQAFADPAFQRDLADLKARCRSASRPKQPGTCCDIAFDTRHEREEGWAWEPIKNVFA
jgi:hypothetical protein